MLLLLLLPPSGAQREREEDHDDDDDVCARRHRLLPPSTSVKAFSLVSVVLLPTYRYTSNWKIAKMQIGTLSDYYTD